MADVTFYRKPNCINNLKQRDWLLAAGHTVIEKDILMQAWTPQALIPFFAGRPLQDWFNPTAPAITSGRLRTATLSKGQALEAMVEDPLLIKRPLMIVNGHHLSGFDVSILNGLIGMEAAPGQEDTVDTFRKSDVVTCPQQVNRMDCDSRSRP